MDAKDIIALKEEARRDLEALERVEKLLARKHGSPAPDDRQGTLPLILEVADTITVEDDLLDVGTTETLRGKMEDILRKGGPTEKWTNQKMLNHLVAVKFPLRAKKPIYSIGQTMQKIEESGIIKIVRKGAGNQPHIYKLKAVAETQAEPAKEDSTSNHAVI